MTVFWLVAGCLTVASLLFVLPPLLNRGLGKASVDHSQLNASIYRDQLAELDRDLANNTIDQGHYERTRHELERRLLQDVDAASAGKTLAGPSVLSRSTAVGLMIGIPALAVSLYLSLGEPSAISGVQSPMLAAQQGADDPSSVEHPDTDQQVQAMVAQLAARMEQTPDDFEGWLMLARSYRFLRRHADAVAAFDKAMPIVETNPQLLADYADTLAMATGGALEGKPMRLIRQALELDPTNTQALWLAGTYDFDKGNYESALQHWRRLHRTVPPGSQDAQAMEANIAEVEARLREQGKPIPPPEVVEAPPAPSGPAAVAGTVSLDPSLEQSVSPTDTVFIFARAANGPRLPLAIIRKQAGELPVAFSLDDSMAMMAGMSLADYPEVVVGARVSKSGNAMAQSGDIQGMSSIVKVGASDLQITINELVP